MDKSIKVSIAAGVACATLWLPLWFVANIIFTIVFTLRGDPAWAWTFTKEVLDSIAGTYFAFAIVGHFAHRVDWRFAFGTFAILVVAIFSVELMWNAEYYLTAGRVAEFRSFMLWTSLAFILAIATGLVMSLKNWPLPRAQALTP